MFRYFLKLAVRNFVKNKTFSVINIIGLAVGMAGTMLLLVWIGYEFSFENFQKNKERIFEVYNLSGNEGSKQAWSGNTSLLGPVLKSNYPQFEEVSRVNYVGNFIFSKEDKHLEAAGFLTDPGFLRTFSYPLVKGDVNTALDDPRSLVLTEMFARKLFGDAEALGQILRIDSTANFKVTGVLKDLPKNTRFQFDYLVPFTYRQEIGWDILKWDDYSVQTFVMLKGNITEGMGNNLIRNVIKNNAPEMKNELFLHPMSKWHLYSNFENGKPSGGAITQIRLLTLIAAFILLIACINYMNLSTARSEKRAREVGIHKVVGATRRSLMRQFIGESILLTTIAGILALGLAQLSMNAFNQVIFGELSIPYSNFRFWLYGAAFILVTGLIAGSYPAFYLSAHRIINVLKGKFKSAGSLVSTRKVLVVVQFTFAIVFIICTIVIYQQVQLGENRERNFDSNNLVYIFRRGDVGKNYQLISNELYQKGAITSVTQSNSPITGIWTWDDTFTWPQKDIREKKSIATYHADNDFVKTMGLILIEGRDFNTNNAPTDTMAVILNETAAKMMNFDRPVGQIITNSQGNWKVIGVVKDFVALSPYHPVMPLIIQGPKNWMGTVSFRLNPANPVSENLATIGAVIRKYNPDYPSDFRFVDVDLADRFNGVSNTGTLAAIFACLSIFISCLGLYALAAYMAENRLREIGIRKVMGASVASITSLLSRDFVKLVMISFVIASPVAWWLMRSWLQDFTYRVSLQWWVFVLTGVTSLTISIVTISYQSIKAALTNPVKTLRSD